VRGRLGRGPLLRRLSPHGSQFELSTGRPISLPATEPVETYPVRVVDGTIVLELP
jgi:nitrite reductase/ring-hydroxylating ferredoxin subunit